MIRHLAELAVFGSPIAAAIVGVYWILVALGLSFIP